MTQRNESPGVTAIVAHYGAVELTKGVVNDLLHQSHSPLEIIVTDDASPAAFPEMSGVHVLRSEVNGGYGAALNRGARVARYPWLLLLNNDVRLSREVVAEAMEHATSMQPSILGFRHQTKQSYVPSAAPLPTILSTLAQHCDAIQPLARRLGWGRSWRWEDPQDATTRAVGWVSGAAILMPTGLFKSVGGFDERFFMYSEEVDLQRRLKSVGVPSYLLGSIAVEHTGGGSTSRLDSGVEQLRSRLLYQEISSGKSSRKLLEIGLRSVLAADSLYHGARRLAGKADERQASMAARRRSLTLALSARS